MMIYTIERLRSIKPGETMIYYRGPSQLAGPADFTELMERIFKFAYRLESEGRVRLDKKEIARYVQNPGYHGPYVEYEHVAVGL
jgi:hypothetical protein